MLAMIALIKVIRSGGATVTAQCRLPAPQYPVPAQGRHIDHGPQPLALTERGDAADRVAGGLFGGSGFSHGRFGHP